MITTPPGSVFRILGTYRANLVVLVPQNRNLNAVPGLLDWMGAIDPQLEAEGLRGFLFPDREDQVPDVLPYLDDPE